MSKFKAKTLGELMPKGTCFLCKHPCDPEAYIHFACGIAYTEEKARLIKQLEKPLRPTDDNTNIQ